MGKGSTQMTTQRNEMDPATARYIQAYRQRAMQQQGAAGALNPYLQDVAGSASGMMGRGLGFGMQTGLAGINEYLDPYLNEVVGGMRGDFDYQRGQANNAAADMATRAGAYGGDREAILRAEMMGGVNRNEASTLAGLRSAGFSQASNQLMGDRARMGGYGLAGMQGLMGLGQHLDANQLASLQAMLGGFTPTSTTGTTTQQTQGDLWGDLMGLGGMAGMAFGGIPSFAGLPFTRPGL